MQALSHLEESHPCFTGSNMQPTKHPILSMQGGKTGGREKEGKRERDGGGRGEIRTI